MELRRRHYVGGIDSDASLFINAAGITDPIQAEAINTLAFDLKINGLWSKMKAVYPFVGGTDFSHKFNLIDSRDLDISYRISFNGVVTHDINGIKGNGVNGYGNTFFNFLNVFSTDNQGHISIYSRSDIAETREDIGASSNSTTRVNDLLLRTSANALYGRFATGNSPAIGNVNSKGFFEVSSIGVLPIKLFKNGLLLGSDNTPFVGHANNNIYICCLNYNGIPNYFASKNYSFATLGDGLTEIESSNLYTIVQKFQTTLNRQV